MVRLLLHVGTVAFEGCSELFDDLLHFGANTMAFVAGLCDNSLRMLFLLDEWRVTFGSLQMLFLIISPW